MYCTKCGSQNVDDAKFCKNCGQGLSSTASSSSTDSDNTTTNNNNTSTNNNSLITHSNIPTGDSGRRTVEAVPNALDNTPFGENTSSSPFDGVPASNSNVPPHNPYTYPGQRHSAYTNPYKGYAGDQRSSYSTFVFVIALIMGIMAIGSFLMQSMSTFASFAGIEAPDGAISKEIPDLYNTYRGIKIPQLLITLLLAAGFMTIVVLARKLQRKAIENDDVNVRIKLNKVILILILSAAALIIIEAVIQSVLYSMETKIALELFEKGWSSDDISKILYITVQDSESLKDAGLDFESMSMVTHVVGVVIGFGWQIAMMIVALVKTLNIGNFLKTQTK